MSIVYSRASIVDCSVEVFLRFRRSTCVKFQEVGRLSSLAPFNKQLARTRAISVCTVFELSNSSGVRSEFQAVQRSH
jgi:hypothetical protein